MSEPVTQFPADLMLTETLRSLPVPVPSADFDDRVLAALRVPVPLWQRVSWRRVWQPVQPLLLGTSCSLGLTLLLLHLTLSGPPPAPLPSSPVTPSVAAAPPEPMPSLDALLDRPNLCAGSLALAWNSIPAPEPESTAPEKADRRPEPRRRASFSRRPSLVA